MTITVTLFDGTQLNFPDDTPEEVIDRVAMEETLALGGGGTGSSAVPPPDPALDPLVTPRAGESVGQPPGTPPPPKDEPDTLGGAAMELASGPYNEAARYSEGIWNTAKSPSYAALREELPGMNPALAATLSKFGDTGMAAFNLLGAGVAGGAGLVMEAVPGLPDQGEKELAQSALTGLQFAGPELAGVSSVGGTAARGGAKTATPKAAPKPAVPTMSRAEIEALANKAARGGMGSVRAEEQLAAAAKLNPEAKAAADRLGIELPADVFSDNPQISEMAGQTRGIAGSEASSAWMQTVTAAKKKADELMESMDGSPDLASISDEVKTSVTKTRDDLQKAAKDLFAEVDAAVPPPTLAIVDNSTKLLNKIIEELGGVDNLTAEEKRLYRLITNPDVRPTYAAVQREKTAIGTAMDGKKKSVYDTSDAGLLKRIYGALSADQKLTVETVGDATILEKLNEANSLTAKQKAIEKRIVKAYGGEVDGSIGMKLRTALSTGSKGDISVLNRIMKVIPDDLKAKALITAISNMSRQASGADAGTFGLPQFSKMWEGVKQNKPVMNLIGTTVGPEVMAVLNDLGTITKRINKAQSFVLGTGKANQALKSPLGAQGLINNLASSSFGERAGRAAGTAVGMATGGLPGAIVGSEAVAAMLAGAKKNVLGAVGNMLNSNEFLEAAVEASTKGSVSPATAAKLKKSSRFAEWAKSVGRSPEALINELIETPGAPAVGATAAQPQEDRPWLQLEGRY